MLTDKQKAQVKAIRERYSAFESFQDGPTRDVDTLLTLIDQLQQDAEAYERNLQEWLDDVADY